MDPEIAYLSTDLVRVSFLNSAVMVKPPGISKWECNILRESRFVLILPLHNSRHVLN
jgi:hypothetical protein